MAPNVSDDDLRRLIDEITPSNDTLLSSNVGDWSEASETGRLENLPYGDRAFRVQQPANRDIKKGKTICGKKWRLGRQFRFFSARYLFCHSFLGSSPEPIGQFRIKHKNYLISIR